MRLILLLSLICLIVPSVSSLHRLERAHFSRTHAHAHGAAHDQHVLDASTLTLTLTSNPWGTTTRIRPTDKANFKPFDTLPQKLKDADNKAAKLPAKITHGPRKGKVLIELQHPIYQQNQEWAVEPRSNGQWVDEWWSNYNFYANPSVAPAGGFYVNIGHIAYNHLYDIAGQGLTPIPPQTFGQAAWNVAAIRAFGSFLNNVIPIYAGNLANECNLQANGRYYCLERVGPVGSTIDLVIILEIDGAGTISVITAHPR